ncbi:MAG: hypothetical protein QOI90_2818, partial [Mycobacterium sp.]|nr:hypothetical protein [Mycobacterium sp.]
DALQSGQCSVIDADALAIPPHTSFEHQFEIMSRTCCPGGLGVLHKGPLPQALTGLAEKRTSALA